MDHTSDDERQLLLNESDEERTPQVIAPVVSQPGGDGEAAPVIPSELPILPVRNVVVFPGTVMPLTVGRQKSQRLIDAVLAGNKLLAVFSQRKEDVDDPGIDDIYRVGTVAQVLKLLRMPDGTNSLLVHGIVRAGLESFSNTEPYWTAVIHPNPDSVKPSIELEALVYNARRTAERVIELSPNVPDEALQVLASIDKPPALADFLAANLSLGLVQKQELLETFDVLDRLRKVNATLQNQLEILELAQKLQTDVRTQVDKTQREYYLQEQMKAIQRELGEGDSRAGEIAELTRRVQEAGMPELVLKEARRELARLERIPQASPENSLIRDFLDWLIELPWTQETQDNLDLNHASEILDADHFGLEKIKRRILEYLAVRKLKPDGQGPILCFAGPPGVGKTSLGQSIARALGRKFIRIALGGVRDEADIRGHRRTYIGSIPGRIIQEMRKAGTLNPVIMLDELDKLGADFRGDPGAALLEVLDPEQNHSFTDHYLGLPFDLSKVMFIGTANYLEPVPGPLRDRMEIIELSGYTTTEKVEIARRYLVPRQRERNGLQKHAIEFSADVLRKLIEGHTREAGVRNLERTIGTVCRGIAARVARGEKPPKVTLALCEELLGPPRFEREEAARVGIPGVATGLAYTPVGGDLIFIEATRMPGRGGFSLTGQVGDVMRESAQAALSLLRSRADDWGVDLSVLPQSDIHVHVPAGAVPKDGPSAGVALLVSLFSLLSDRPADPNVAMTGEVTLRGLVLPVGGIKEKVLAAHRSGIRTVILPARNEPDLLEVPPEVRAELKFVFASRVEQALPVAVPSAKSRKTAATSKPAARSASKTAGPTAALGRKKPARKPPAGKSARARK